MFFIFVQMPYGLILNIYSSMNSEDKIVILKLKKITVISLIFMIVQILGGYYAHSIAIFADAFHLLSDVLAYMISLFAVLMSYHVSPKALTFGYEKLQPLGALINVGIIWFVTAELFIQATNRIFHKAVVEEPTYMLATSIFGLVCNLYILNILHSDEHAGGHHNCSHSHHKHAHNEEQHHEQHHHDHHTPHAHGSCSHDHHKKEQKNQHHQHEDHEDHQHHEHNQHHDHESHHDHHHEHGQCKGKHSQMRELEIQLKEHECSAPSNFASDSARDCCGHSNKHSLELSNNKMNDQIGLPSLSSAEQMHSNSHDHHNNINMKAAYIHIITDIILSIGVIISATIIYFFAPEGHVWSNWQIADPICTYIFSILAIYSTMPIIKESLVLLLDGCSDQKLIDEIESAVKNHAAVKRVESLRVWTASKGKIYGALRVIVTKGDTTELKNIFTSRKIEGYVQLDEQQEKFNEHKE